jgi:hypothetical protein
MRRSCAALEVIRESYLACRRVFTNRATESGSKSHGLLVCLANSVFRMRVIDKAWKVKYYIETLGSVLIPVEK